MEMLNYPHVSEIELLSFFATGKLSREVVRFKFLTIVIGAKNFNASDCPDQKNRGDDISMSSV